MPARRAPNPGAAVRPVSHAGRRACRCLACPAGPRAFAYHGATPDRGRAGKSRRWRDGDYQTIPAPACRRCTRCHPGARCRIRFTRRPQAGRRAAAYPHRRARSRLASMSGKAPAASPTACCNMARRTSSASMSAMASCIRDSLPIRVSNITRASTPAHLEKSALAGRQFDLIVADVSFISLTLIIPQLPPLLTRLGDLLLLVKPQFEVGTENIGKGGIVADPCTLSSRARQARRLLHSPSPDRPRLVRQPHHRQRRQP